MSGNVILDVAIGLAFIYLILSLMCSAIQEFLATLFAMRANNLETGVRNMLNDPNAVGIADKFFAHPLITRLAKEGKKPSYIPSRMFALALLDSLKSPPVQVKGSSPAGKPADESASSQDKVQSPMALASETVGDLPDGQLKTALSALIADAEGDVNKIRSNIETWFDDSMDCVSGWYKRKAKLIMLGIAFLLAAGLNVDSIHVTQILWKDPGLRESIVAQAQSVNKTATIQPNFALLDQQLNALQLPIGWHCEPKDKALAPMVHNFGPTTLLGWLITAICVSLGAPFWFDALEKVLNIRAEGNKPNKSVAAGK